MDARLLRLQHPENVRAFPSESVLMPDSTQIRDAIPDRLSPPPLMTAVSTPLWTVPLADVLVSDDEIADVSAVYRSGWLTQGPLTRAFEEAIEAYTGAPSDRSQQLHGGPPSHRGGRRPRTGRRGDHAGAHVRRYG